MIPGLDCALKENIISTLKNIKVVDAIYLFGSRARGDYQERSDIDLAIKCQHVTDADWEMIMNKVQLLPTLLKIDCIRLDILKASNPLYQAIMRDKVTLYQKGL